MKNRSEFVISPQNIKQEGLRINSGIDISLISFEDSHSLEFVEIHLDGKISRINNSEYIFRAKISGFCNLSCSFCLELFQLNLDESFRVFFLPPLQNKYLKEDELELVSTDLEVSDLSLEGIDLFPSIRDHILLSIPVQPLCGEDCVKINPLLSPTGDEKEIPGIDNRWSTLKDFKLKK